MVSVPKNVAPQRKGAPLAAAAATATTTVAEINELTPARQSTRIAEKKMASAPKDALSPQRKQAPIAVTAAATAATHTTAATTRARKSVKRKKKFGLPDKKKVPVEELEVRYSTTGQKVYVCFSDDSDDEDYIAEDSS